MRIIRKNYERVWYPYSEFHLDRTEERNYTGEMVVEGRILLNRFEAKVIEAVWWVLEIWDERLAYPLSRLCCRWFGRCGVGCRGRTGCIPKARP